MLYLKKTLVVLLCVKNGYILYNKRQQEIKMKISMKICGPVSTGETSSVISRDGNWIFGASELQIS